MQQTADGPVSGRLLANRLTREVWNGARDGAVLVGSWEHTRARARAREWVPDTGIDSTQAQACEPRAGAKPLSLAG